MSSSKFDIVVLGSIVRDVLINVPKVVTGQNGFTLGYGMKTLIDSHEPNVPGGSAANFGLAYQKLATRKKSVALVGIVGKKDGGEELLKKIDEAGIHTGFVEISDIYETDTSYIILSKNGTTTDRSIFVLKRASYHLSEETIPDPIDTRAIVFTSVPYDAKPSVEKLLENKAQFKIAAPSQTMINEYQGMNRIEELKELIRNTDFCIMNETESKLIYNESNNFVKLTDYFPLVEKMRRDLDLENAVITCGKLGSVGANKNGSFAVEAPNLEKKIQNTTGAGDTYAAGVIYSKQNNVKVPPNLSEIDDLEKAMLVGTAAASLKLINPYGDRPNKTEVENYISHSMVKKHGYITFNSS